MVAGHCDLPNVTPLRILSVWFQPTEGAPLLAAPVPVTVTELGITVTPVRVMLGIFFPQQPFGYMRPLQLLVHRRPVRNLVAPAIGGIGAGIKQLGQPGVIQVSGERPAQLQALGPAQQLLDPADTQLGAAADVADGQTGSVPEPEYVS